MARVYGMHRLVLKSGEDPREFERYAAEVVYPALDGIPGLSWRLLKGYAGDREGKYLALFEFDSEERLSRYISGHQGEFSEEFEALLAPVSTKLERLGEFLVSMSDPASTDYVVVGE